MKTVPETSPPSRIPCVQYAAKSTEDVRGSIRTQHDDTARLIEKEGEGRFVYGDPQSDERASAYHGNRGPGLAKARRLAEEAAAKHGGAELWVQHSDRLARGDARKAQHLGELYFWAIKLNISLRSVQDDATFTNPLLAFAMGERNAEDSRRKSLAVRAGMERRKARGLHNGRAPFGYRSEEGRLVSDRAQAEVVRRIFREWVEGISQYRITQRLNVTGLRTQLGRDWNQGTVGKLLKNEVYAGRRDGEPCRCGHEALVTEEMFAEAQKLMGGRHDRGGPNRRPAGSHLFLNGFLRCGLCGGPMLPRTDRRRDYEVYMCSRHRNHGAGSCAMPIVHRRPLERDLLAYLTDRHIDVRRMITRYEESISQQVDGAVASRDEAARAATQADERLGRVRRHFQDGRLEPADWTEQRRQLTEEAEAARAEEARLTERAVELRQHVAGRDGEEEVLKLLADLRERVIGPVADAETVDGLRVAFRQLFKSLHVYPAGSAEAVALADFGADKDVIVPTSLDGRWGASPREADVSLPVPANSYAEGLVR